jgi:hypothetical protein
LIRVKAAPSVGVVNERAASCGGSMEMEDGMTITAPAPLGVLFATPLAVSATSWSR